MHDPTFDTWTIIFLFAAVQGLFISSVLFFARKENRQARFLLGAITFLFSVTLIEYVLWWTGYLLKFIHFFHISASFPFLFGPLLLFYFKSVFQSYRFRAIDLLTLLPFLLNFIDFSAVYFEAAEIKRQWYSGEVRPPRPSTRHWHWIRIGHMIIYAVLIVRQFNPLSRSQHEVKAWFRYLTGFYLCFIVSYASYYILILFPGFNKSWDYMISFSMLLFIYFIAWFGYLQPGVFSGFTLAEAITGSAGQQKYRHSPLTDEISEEIVRKLETIMQKDRLYAENDLRLEKLALAVGTGKHILSQVINEKIGMSFFEYINRLRIREAQQLLIEKNKAELNIIEIAYKVGFNNKVSFNTTFKKITGMTPTEYRKQKTLEATANLN